MHLCVDDLIDTKPLCIQTAKPTLIRLQKVVYIVSASINRLNDQLPRDYSKTSVFGTDWIKLIGILQV